MSRVLRNRSCRSSLLTQSWPRRSQDSWHGVAAAEESLERTSRLARTSTTRRVAGGMVGASRKGLVVHSRWHSLIARMRERSKGASAPSTGSRCTSPDREPASTLSLSTPPANCGGYRKPSIFASSGKAGSKASSMGGHDSHRHVAEAGSGVEIEELALQCLEIGMESTLGGLLRAAGVRRLRDGLRRNAVIGCVQTQRPSASQAMALYRCLPPELPGGRTGGGW
jgi:hypothetical protein